MYALRNLIVIRVLTIMCCLVFRVEAEVGECFPLEVIVLFHEYKDFFFVLSLFFFSKQCQLDISIDSLTSNSATEVVEVLAEVFFEALPCFWVTTCIFLERHSELLLNISYQIANNCQGITIAFLQQFLISTLLERHDLALSVLKWHV